MKCPYDWSAITGNDWEDSILQADWHYALGKVSYEDIDLPFSDWELQLLEGHDDEISDLIRLLEDRHDEAVEFYNNKCAGRLRNIHFVTPSEHGKHFIEGVDEAGALRRTRIKKKQSLFLKNLTSDELKKEFWDWVFRYCGPSWDYFSYRRMWEPDEEDGVGNELELVLWRSSCANPIRECMRLNRVVGASEGALTNCICYDFHLDTREAHCFPVTEGGAKQILGEESGFDYEELNRPL